jgi:hypothetical protein
VVDVMSVREKELQRRLLQSTSTELVEELALRIRRQDLDKVPPEIFEKLERGELEELHFETVMKMIDEGDDHINVWYLEADGAKVERLFHLYVLLMLSDGFELVEGE